MKDTSEIRSSKAAIWLFGAVAATLYLGLRSCAGASVVDEALLNKVAWTESRNNPSAVGKLGEVGAYQLRPIAIREVNRIYGTSYTIKDATTPKAREIARLYLLICESRVRVKTAASVYAKYRGVK